MIEPPSSMEKIGDAARDGASKIIFVLDEKSRIVVIVDECSLNENGGHVGVMQDIVIGGLRAAIPMLIAAVDARDNLLIDTLCKPMPRSKKFPCRARWKSRHCNEC